MKLTILVADYAVATPDGKLTVVGGGWAFVGPQVGPTALAMLVEVPWGDTNREHVLTVELRDEDGNMPLIGPEAQPVRFEAKLEVGRPPGHPPGAPFNVPIALNFPSIPLLPGTRYKWVASIDGETDPNWEAGFNVRPAAST